MQSLMRNPPPTDTPTPTPTPTATATPTITPRPVAPMKCKKGYKLVKGKCKKKK